MGSDAGDIASPTLVTVPTPKLAAVPGASAAASSAPKATPGPVSFVPEVPAAEVCRPQLFLRPEIAGLIEATTICSGEQPEGVWLLCTQRSDGRREMRPLPLWLDSPPAPRLWLSPCPHPPPAGVVPGWSAVGRRRWLEGHTPDLATLFQEIQALAGEFIVFPDELMPGAPAVVALWTMLTYCYPAWPAVPYIHITGPLGSGKSRLLEFLFRLAWRATSASSMTAGVVFRTLHERGGTFLIDEAERLGEKSSHMSELLTLLLAGYKAGGRVSRLQRDGQGYHPVHFDVFGPKVLASIGDLVPTLTSRSIRSRMLRTAGDRPEVQARMDACSERWQTLRDDLHTFSLTHAGAILQVANTTDPLAGGMSGRDAELWRPLLGLAQLCRRGTYDDLPSRIREYADRVISESVEDTSPDPDRILVCLLTEAVVTGQADLTPKDLLGRAQREDGVTFARWTPHRIASTLKRYGLLTHKTGRGRRSYHDVTLEQLRRVARDYRMSTLLDDASSASNATPDPSARPTNTI